ncbi:hypothetical protein RHGRI_010984 [Rhododendron griersonianum]|uniref:Uncharacterized protein n=1 Tax=Rhododendron griersonianum TaxID=479676 RepID=A0AAV6KL97_9ERIC|nr:hypothetical protein RHGRI_010984 [Rhododendron griersonianum]
MTHGMPKIRVAKAWQADCLSPGKAMRCSRHAKKRGGQGMASRLLVTGQGNALLTACQNKGWPRHDSRHAKTSGGQVIASQFLVTGQGMNCSQHSKTKGGQGMTHGMPKQGVAKAWQVDCLSPSKAMRC